MQEYFDGKKLYGDDFSIEEIEKWYREESEGYANLGNKEKETYSYGYHEINKIYGFKKLKLNHFDQVLGLGSAWGSEFEPIINQISNLIIIEPSDNMINNKIGSITPKYVKPEISGELKFENNTFDLITCFGTLHHIPNVTFVLKEIIRVLKPNGYLLLREPIISMGDWNLKRPGLTKNERGIPVSVFDTVFNNASVKVISRQYYFTKTSHIQSIIGRYFKKPIYTYKPYIYFDKIISYLLKWNIKYHAKKKINKLAPSAIYYVIRKL